MTEVEKLTLEKLDKIDRNVRDLGLKVNTTTVKVEQLSATVEKLDVVVRTGNGKGSLVARMDAQEEVTRTQSEDRAQSEGGDVALAKITASKELWVAVVALLTAGFASLVSLLK